MSLAANRDGLGRLWSIQYARGFSAAAVVAYHQFQNVIPGARFGAHGVDVFFVISGFIMFVTTTRRNVSPSQFAFDRVARIVPLYWIATIGAYLWVLLGGHFFAASTSAPLLWRSVFFIPCFSYMGEIWPTLFLGWTLNYEMFFYALFALVLFVPPYLRLIVCGAGFTVLYAMGLVYGFKSAPALVYTSPLILEFLSGIFLGAIFIRSGHTIAWVVVRVAMIVALLATLSRRSPQLLFAVGAVVGIAGLLILEKSGRLIEIGLLKRLGDASFSVYLFQQFAFETSHLVWMHVAPMPPDKIFHPTSCFVGNWAWTFGVPLFRNAAYRAGTRNASASCRRACGPPRNLVGGRSLSVVYRVQIAVVSQF